MVNLNPDIIDDSNLDDLYPPVCSWCKNFLSLRDKSCRAFPDGIPADIWHGEDKHQKPFVGDQGIQFEAIKRG